MKKIFNKIVNISEFEKDLKKLSKKFPTLREDLNNLIKHGLNAFHNLNIDNRGIFRIIGLGIENPKIYKVKKFASKSIKGKGVQSGIRVIYAYHEEENKIEFIEIYYKGNKALEDRERIKKYCV
jgi:mRNA-degrading endonuclease RelE of RelBE toxin-antitoxin system